MAVISLINSSGASLELHGFGVEGTASVGVNQFPPILFSPAIGSGGITQLHLIRLFLAVPPTGADFHLDILQYPAATSILTTPLVFPAGSTSIVECSTFVASSFAPTVYLGGSILQVGSGVAGGMMKCLLAFSPLGSAGSVSNPTESSMGRWKPKYF